MAKRVVVVGGAADPEQIALYREAGSLLWGLNAVLWPFGEDRSMKSVARWFQIHPPKYCDDRELAWAKRCPVPLEAIQHYPQWPTSRPYPLDAVCRLPNARDIGFASTFAYAVALACHEHVKELVLLGVAYRYGTVRERAVERGNLAAWVGLARGRGMKVVVTPDEPGSVPGGHLYGFDYSRERAAVARYCWELQQVRQIDGD